MITELSTYTKERLIKVLAINNFNSRIEKVFEAYTDAKIYAKTLEQQGFIVMFEPLPFNSFKELAQKHLDQIKNKDVVVEFNHGGFYV